MSRTAPSPSPSPSLESGAAGAGAAPSAGGKLTAAEKARRAAQPFAFLGFSAGPRKCIGKNLAMIEIKVIFTLLLQRFDMVVLPNQYIAANPITRLPKNGINIKLTRRTAPIQTEFDAVAAPAAGADGVRQRTDPLLQALVQWPPH